VKKGKENLKNRYLQGQRKMLNMTEGPPPDDEHLEKLKNQAISIVSSNYSNSTGFSVDTIISWDNHVFIVAFDHHQQQPNTDCGSTNSNHTHTHTHSHTNGDVVGSNIEKRKKAVVRFPCRIPYPPSHSPKCQHWVSSRIYETGARVTAKQIQTGTSFLLETFIEGVKLKTISEARLRGRVLNQLGLALKKIHSVSTKGYGRFEQKEDGEFVGSFECWSEFFQQVFGRRWEWAKEENLLTRQVVETIDTLYDKVKPYINKFDTPCLLHGDLCYDNIIIKPDGIGNYDLSGIVDFCDALSGDPLFDLAEVIGLTKGDWNEFGEMFLSSYTPLFTAEQKEIVQLYAALMCVYYMFEDAEQVPKNKPPVRHHKLKQYTNALHEVINFPLF
jgi:fructosamine-3-kinase